MKRKKRARHTSKHHIIPRSRGGKIKNNIALIDPRDHERYHALFSNKTPVEILHWLARYFWDGNYKFLEQALKESTHED